MSKIPIKVSIKNKEENKTIEVQSIFHDDTIKNKEEKDITVLFDYDKKRLIRETPSFKMIYRFNENEGIIYLKEQNLSLDVKIKVENLYIEKPNVKINYKIDNDIFTYEIEAI